MYVIGIDVGTSGTKAVLLDKDGTAVGQGQQGYGLFTSGNRVEQDAEDWWRAAIAAVRQATSGVEPKQIEAIGLSTQGASMVALDAEGQPLGRAITWLDGRSAEEAELLQRELGGDIIYRTTGWQAGKGLDAAKLLHLKRRGQYSEAACYLSTLEYMNLRLTGRAVIDPTNAAMRQMFDYRKGDWDDNILNAVGVERSELPEIRKTGASVGTLLPEAAKLLGLPPSVTVYNGAHDQYCASLGSGAVSAGDMLVSTGTAWAILGMTEQPMSTASRIASCTHPVPGLYGNMATLAGAGTAYEWAAEQFSPGKSFGEIDRMALEAVEKNSELFFVPWTSGANYPFWISSARGGFIGINFATNGCDMALAVMESAVFHMRMALEDFTANGFSPAAIRLMGGASRSPAWMNLFAALIDLPAYQMAMSDACALGAASIAACGAGWYSSYKEASDVLAKKVPLPPTTLDRDFYEDKYRRYCLLLVGLADLYRKE